MHRDNNQDQDLTERNPGTGLADPASADRPSGHRTSRTTEARAARAGFRGRISSTPLRVTLAVGVACGLGVVAVAKASDAGDSGDPPPAAVAERIAAAEQEPASRASERAPVPTATPASTSTAPSPTSSATAKAKPTRKVTKPTRPRPVAGLTQAQMDNAHSIVRTGRQLGVARRGLVVGIATALQESNLYNLANGGVPESLELPNQGTGWDHDSVGLFQQRPSSGWGEVEELMRPSIAARRFFEALLEVPGWQEMAVSVAAQSVQVSAFPDAYAQHEDRAEVIVDALI